MLCLLVHKLLLYFVVHVYSVNVLWRNVTFMSLLQCANDTGPHWFEAQGHCAVAGLTDSFFNSKMINISPLFSFSVPL